MYIRIFHIIRNYLRLYQLTPKERHDFETIRRAIVCNPNQIAQIEYAPFYVPICRTQNQTYAFESDIKMLISHYVTISYTSPLQNPPSVPIKHHDLRAYVAWPDGGFTDLSDTKRAYLLLKTMKRKAKKYGTTTYCDSVNYEKEFIAKHGTHVR